MPPRRWAAAAVALTIAASRADSAPDSTAPAKSPGAWRGARWAMTVDELLKVFPGEAVRLDPEQKLPDGNVIAAGIEKHVLEGQELRVRFVFTDGKLALVSLRSPPDQYAHPEVYAKLREHLARQLGSPGEETKDDNFVDLRQTRWDRAPSRIDLKYIPGVVVLLYSPLAPK